MSIEFRDEIYAALNLTALQRETGDLIDWSRLRAKPDLGRAAARYLPQIGVIQINQRTIHQLEREERYGEILALMLHERAHQFIGRVCGDYEAHNSLFAGICWGLQRRAGVSAGTDEYDIQDEPSAKSRALDIAQKIDEAPNTATAVRLIEKLIEVRRGANRTQAVGALLPMLALPATIFVVIKFFY